MLLAVTQSGFVTVTVAAIAAVGGVAAAYAANAARRDVLDRIGTPNGQGNVVEMMERLLAGQAGQDNRIARLEGNDIQRGIVQSAHDERICRLEQHPTLAD